MPVQAAEDYLRTSALRIEFGDQLVLDSFEFSIAEGEVVSLLGPSGCGKSTLFNVLSGLLQPQSGQVLLQGMPVTGERRHAAYMFQEHSLLPWRTVLDNVLLPAEIEPAYASADFRRQCREQALGLLASFGLEEAVAKYPAQLSGGMRQRAALARTFMAARPLYLFDEPFSGLDLFRRLRLEKMLSDFLRHHRRTCLLITHDLETALALSHKVLLLDGPPCRICRQVDGMAGRSSDPVQARTLPEFETAIRHATETLAEIFHSHAHEA